MFERLSRDARRWLKAPSEEGLGALLTRAREATPEVPEARRGDWDKLLSGLGREGPLGKQAERVEGLVRACRLFAPLTAPPAPALHAFDAVDRLPGLGPAAREALAKSGVTAVGDLVWTLPVAWDDLRDPISIAEVTRRASEAQAVGARVERTCVRGIVKSAALVPMRGRRSVRVTLADEHEPARLLYATWFFAAHGILALAKVGRACLAVGRVRLDDKGRAQLAHPDLLPDDASTRVVRPRYPRLGVGETILRRAVGVALDRLPQPPDPVPPSIAERERMEACAPLLRAAHGAGGALQARPSASEVHALLERMAWAEAFTRAWDRLRAESRQGEARAPVLAAAPAIQARLRAELGFTLTPAQTRAIHAIAEELAKAAPMRRLLLGDVGTGKTAVALAAAAQAVAAHAQVAILAPTSVLAEQYMDAVAPLARATRAAIALVVGGGTAGRARLEGQIEAGAIDVVIGTHALLGAGIRFKRLGLVVVDEQHRLGVAQRLALVQKGPRPHLLTLSATPIPRTMALALRGELATSVLEERPKGRLPTTTRMQPRTELPAVQDEIRAACGRGERVFYVCPRVEEDEDDDEIPSAVARAGELEKALAPFKVVLVHGGLKPESKRRAMRAFRAGEAQVLVGTTVVEVGVDVPEATLMVVEGAERYGLAQLHQLRGRVGRGARPGTCILVHGPLEPLARSRLEAVCRLSSGTEIARADLELRGAGDLGGTRQSGLAEELFYLDPADPPAWLARIDADARALFASDPGLEQPGHSGLRLFVRRFAVALAVREEAG